MSVSEITTKKTLFTSWVWMAQGQLSFPSTPPNPTHRPTKKRVDLLQPVRDWLDGIEVRHRKLAHWICHLIPAQCPFERDIKVLGHTLFHIPPMCKLNPLYNELIGLRFRALCYLADECGEDISIYC